MKILMLNGSPRANGNTALALGEMAEVFAREGLETELMQVGNRDIRGCIACRRCKVLGRCVFDDLVNELAEYADAFEKVAVGEPLLTSDEDFAAVMQAIVAATAEYDDGETAICFMGHGTEADSNGVYAHMQELLTASGYANYFIGTVEAAPTLDDVLAAVGAGEYKKVVLRPLMIVAGDHANNDMASDEEDSWKSAFEAAGYEVTCVIEGLGQLEAIQQLFVDHAQAAIDSVG